MDIKPLKKGAIDLTGMRFGYLTVLGPGDIVYYGLDGRGRRISSRKWRVHCALCDRESQINGKSLKYNNRVESCGECGRKRAGDNMKECAIRDNEESLIEIAAKLRTSYNTIYQRYQNGDRGDKLRRPLSW